MENKMRKRSLNQTLDRAYSYADSNLVELKSAMIGLCIDIERYFKVAFDANLNEKIDDDTFRRILIVFPRFRSLTIEQFNIFIILFVYIRGVNAHLYLSKPIYLDADLKEFIINNALPQYIIEDENKLTVYGSVLVLSMMAQKYMIWPFCTSFLRNQFFIEIEKNDAMSHFQISQQNFFNNICGIGKPLTQNATRVSGVELSYINDVLKRCLTSVFFDLEKVFANYKGCSKKTTSFSSTLKHNELFDKRLISRIICLRNCWFHGSFIGDEVEYNNKKFKFSLEFAVETLKGIAKEGKKDPVTFSSVINDISYFAQNFFNYYVLRMVEVSYKILDNRLLTKDKVESRLTNAERAFRRINNVDISVFEMLSELICHEEIKWNVGASKFLDKCPRKFDCSNLKIAKIHCSRGFTIGGFKTERTDIILALVGIKEDYKNLVNGIDLYDYEYKVVKTCSKFISIIEMKIDD